jgi:mycothiol synthase
MNESPRPPQTTDWVLELAARARAIDGQPPFSDGALLEWRNGSRSLLALGEYAAALFSHTEAEFVVDPDARGRGHGNTLLEHLLHPAHGELLFWAHGDHPAARALARKHKLVAVRELLHLRGAVPPPREEVEAGISAAGVSGAAGASVATGISAASGNWQPEWLALNARAFAHHPEQGGLSRADLDQLALEPWFDAADILLLRVDGALVGSCWLKIEGESGEFYAVAVDPDHQGSGLGRRLMEAGFAQLAARGIRSAHLYVEADNAPALALYRSFGFEPAEVDIQYAPFPK